MSEHEQAHTHDDGVTHTHTEAPAPDAVEETIDSAVQALAAE